MGLIAKVLPPTSDVEPDSRLVCGTSSSTRVTPCAGGPARGRECFDRLIVVARDCYRARVGASETELREIAVDGRNWSIRSSTGGSTGCSLVGLEDRGICERQPLKFVNRLITSSRGCGRRGCRDMAHALGGERVTTTGRRCGGRSRNHARRGSDTEVGSPSSTRIELSVWHPQGSYQPIHELEWADVRQMPLSSNPTRLQPVEAAVLLRMTKLRRQRISRNSVSEAPTRARVSRSSPARRSSIEDTRGPGPRPTSTRRYPL